MRTRARVTWLTTILAILATYRLAHVVAMEDGPFDAFTRLRTRVGQATWVGRGIACPLCLSFWLALPMAGLTLDGGVVGVFVVMWLGVAGGVLILHKVLYG
jgi:hypothetical protein